MNQPNFEQAQKQFDQFTKDAANLNREGIDAFVKSGTIFTQGLESIIKEAMSFAQSSAEKQVQLAKQAMTCKTINEFSDAQNKLAQTSFDDFMSGTTKITELGVKVLSEAIEPINEQVQKSVQKATDAVAAE
ncbi:MAG: phasin family protein [Bdellovibrionales bacterium]